MTSKAPPVAIAVALIAVVVLVAFLWSRNAGAPTPVVDPNNPLPGMGPMNQPGEGMGPSPGAPIPGRGQAQPTQPGQGAGMGPSPGAPIPGRGR